MRKKPDKKIPKVRLAKPAGRPYQMRYTDLESGREVRISTKTIDEGEALDQLDKLKAKLTLGIDPRPRPAVRHDGPSMLWSEFRESFTRLKVATFRSDNAMEAAEVRLDICENVIGPRTLGDMARPATLARLQAELLAGAKSPREKARSAHTVRSYVTTLVAALNWAYGMKWLPERVEFDKLDADDPDKGRPLVGEEFERMLDATAKVVGDADADSWRYLLRGLWESGLRLTEVMMTSWDTDGGIVPEWPSKGLPVLHIPGKLQKNRKAQDVPTTPAFAALLKETPEGQRTGWIFNPRARRGQRRLTPEQVGRIITLIGKRANVAVNAAGKPASAHDLRRSFGQRMADAGLPVRDLQAIMRHASITTTEAYYLRDRVQDQAKRIAKYLGTAEKSAGERTTEAVDVNA
jgi:integrase